MCGIVGYIGHQDVKDILVKGLEKLEYRGYDSAGIAILNNEGLHIYKEQGRIAALREVIDWEQGASLGIGHTRWATHGKPSRRNSHPHTSTSGRFTVVHNGVIENYQELKEHDLSHVAFASDTDTEVIAHLMEHFVENGLRIEEAFRQVLLTIKGSYAIALLDSQDEDTIYVGKNKSPLLIGLGQDFHVIASDAMAMLSLTNQFVELMDEEMVILRRDNKTILNLHGDIMQRRPFQVKLDASDMEKGLYPHYMLKEIDEQPLVIRKVISKYQDSEGSIRIDAGLRNRLNEADRIYIMACGTSYHAGLVGKQLLEKIAGIPVETHIASEFLYNRPILSSKPFFIFISQSGETADSRGVLVTIKQLQYPTLTITNVPGSTLSREADYTLLTYAGPEIAVASTKAYTAQIAVLAILAFDVMRERERAPHVNPFHELSIAANAMEIMINKKEMMEEIVWQYLNASRNCFFIGRGVDYYVSLEGALKLKEISYIQAEGFAGGELKHGTIALIEEGTPAIAILTQAHVRANMRSNVQEIKARGAHVCTISMEGLEESEDHMVLPVVHELLTPLVSVIPLQLIAYYAAKYRGCDIDKPRNLAKSVTVE
ncbi:glutamine--fructose-6-phosphate transaminase (isomerizing) [Paenibacillus roseipurpureus]|uniref:Glutamine--fructose-6-phosphate aminotransferase [isomerizing] n=1 Tax=Paenibacillus roseopurpureus TaxID=2918901 RepID=A0AA96LL71_9BACL|nr:glutamine--fructose-6-phosphate transaminase (isomerizing) [Paenibacillus sp. MBLB1832]WNR43785.1 glutamine--fructose-6-phosphate transaminase (isomerizing) [Paenibacillus sp. MBLB1832]